MAAPGKGNDKGNVEGWSAMPPQLHGADPAVCDMGGVQPWLEEQCRKRQRDRLRGESETIGERLQRDLAAMRHCRFAPFDACDQASGRVSSQSLVRYKTNDYSVPVAYGHQDVWVRGYVDEVVIGCRGEIIARHPAAAAREDVVFDPVHYLPLIEQKINAWIRPPLLQGWDLPEEFATLRRLMEGAHAQAWPARICAGAAPAGELRARRSACGGEAGPPTGRDRLRCRQAPRPVPGRAPPPGWT
jgi:hypothetical protein